MGYWKNIHLAIKTSLQGLGLTLRHIARIYRNKPTDSVRNKDYFKEGDGVFTVQYPYEGIPVPDHGRYRLHNEIDDCIVCDKCAKICPVNCIDIEPIKATEEIGKTSDGTTKRIYAAKFDIDMGKCCFCGLCTTVCPTECLTMTKAYDFSTYDIAEHNYSFAEMSEEDIKEKRQLAEKAKASGQKGTSMADKGSKPGGIFKPKISVKSSENPHKPSYKPRIPSNKPTPDDDK